VSILRTVFPYKTLTYSNSDRIALRNKARAQTKIRTSQLIVNDLSSTSSPSSTTSGFCNLPPVPPDCLHLDVPSKRTRHGSIQLDGVSYESESNKQLRNLDINNGERVQIQRHLPSNKNVLSRRFDTSTVEPIGKLFFEDLGPDRTSEDPVFFDSRRKRRRCATYEDTTSPFNIHKFTTDTVVTSDQEESEPNLDSNLVYSTLRFQNSTTLIVASHPQHTIQINLIPNFNQNTNPALDLNQRSQEITSIPPALLPPALNFDLDRELDFINGLSSGESSLLPTPLDFEFNFSPSPLTFSPFPMEPFSFQDHSLARPQLDDHDFHFDQLAEGLQTTRMNEFENENDNGNSNGLSLGENSFQVLNDSQGMSPFPS
jgi:hypothetical protein